MALGGGLGEQRLQRLHLRLLVDDRAGEIEQQRGLFRWRLGAATEINKIDQGNKQQEQDIRQRQPDPGNAVPYRRKKPAQARGFTHLSIS